MDKAAIARHFGVEVEQIVSVRPEPTDNAILRVLVNYGIGGIKVLHVEEVPEAPEVPAVVVSDKPAADKSAARPKARKPKR